ncbi:MAG: hypothetical protein Q9207_002839 [Kuettlingeria erythrocarpa]
MASRRDPLSAQRRPRASKQSGQAKRPRGIERERPRRSARLKGISQLAKSSEDRNAEKASPNPPAGEVRKGRVPPPILHNPSKLHQKRKREAGPSSHQDQDPPPLKRPRTPPPSCKTEEELAKNVGSNTSNDTADPIETWIQTKKWPSRLFEQDSQAGEDFFEHDSWLEEEMEPPSIPVVQYVEINGMRYPRPIRKVPTSLRRKQSDSSLTASSDQLPREVKSAQYRTANYSIILATKGSFMNTSDYGITTSSKSMCHSLLQTEQTVPQDSLFRDDLFDKTCRNLQDRNEAMVIRNIALLIVPSAQTLATYGATHLNHLFECVNEGWNTAIPFHGTRPQPDYSIGFGRSAFTEQQLKRLDPLVGDILYDSKLTTYFMATSRMYFPFLTCEVKCGAAALDVADRQNAHSMTIAVRGVVELYRAVNREKELHREILAFSISHDHTAVRIYGHYALINGSTTTFYRHPIHSFDFTALDGKDKWTAYKFCKNVYDVWMPIHLKRICSVIDQLPPDLDFKVSQGSELQFTEASGLSQELGGLLSERSNVESTSQTSQDDSELAPIIPQTATPDTSVSQGKGKAAPKRPKRKHTAK